MTFEKPPPSTLSILQNAPNELDWVEVARSRWPFILLDHVRKMLSNPLLGSTRLVRRCSILLECEALPPRAICILANSVRLLDPPFEVPQELLVDLLVDLAVLWNDDERALEVIAEDRSSDSWASGPSPLPSASSRMLA